MNINAIAKIAGVLGFLISVATFILTRIERKKRIEIEVFDSSEFDFPHLISDPESLDGESLVKVRFTNLGSQPVILKPESFLIESEGKQFALAYEDYWGKEEFEELLPPTSSREIGIPLDLIRSKLCIETPKKYDDQTFNKLYPLALSVSDHSGTIFRNNKHSYHEAVSEFIT